MGSEKVGPCSLVAQVDLLSDVSNNNDDNDNDVLLNICSF